MSLKFRARLSFPKFDAKKYTQKLEEECQTQVRQGARAWLRAVLTRVPVWAGTSQGSLKPLGRALNIAINPVAVASARKRKGFGVDFGSSIGESQGTFKFSRQGKRFIFTAETNVDHFAYNNENDARADGIHLTHEPIPWQAFQYGDEAFQKYMNDNLGKRIPRIKDFISFKTKVV